MHLPSSLHHYTEQTYLFYCSNSHSIPWRRIDGEDNQSQACICFEVAEVGLCE